MEKKKYFIIFFGILMILGFIYGLYFYLSIYFKIPNDYPLIIGTGIKYYINNLIGNDLNNGTSPELPWKTIEKVNNFKFSSGDSILFSCNCEWRERIKPQSGTSNGWMYYGSYGNGSLPLFIGSIDVHNSSLWLYLDDNIWYWNEKIFEDVGNLIFNNEILFGIKKWKINELLNQGDFFFEKNTMKLYLKSLNNPGIYYNQIECALGQHMLYLPHNIYPHIGVHSVENIVFENLSFKYGGAYCFKFQNVHHIHINNCNIHLMGGAEVDGQSLTRYGNGIEFFGLSFYCKATNNTITEMYDSGISFQAINSPAAGFHLLFFNNTIKKCGYSGYELWLRDKWGELFDIKFLNNIIIDIGFGWGGITTQRKENSNFGFGILLDTTFSSTKDLIIQGNIIKNSSSSMLIKSFDFEDFQNFLIDNNEYYGNSSQILFTEFQIQNGNINIVKKFQISEKKLYQQYLMKETNLKFF